ncbi:MAG: hypothetical protein E7576_07050 [Ruminococcaceae bacterium]|nr:hypothetical protein [Oscillospiraceae bacterium]
MANKHYIFKNGSQEAQDMICALVGIDDIRYLSDGHHTFDGLYHQRAVLFGALVKANKDLAWKSRRHDDGEYCFGDPKWFIVGINTPKGQYTYHYHYDDYWDLFDCKELDRAPKWDGHDEKDVTRLLSL